MLLALFVLPLVTRAIRPHFLALAVLLVFKPVALVARAVSVVVDAEAVSFVVLPLSIVNITVSMDKAAAAISFVVLPVAFIQRPVDPDLHSFSVFAALSVPLPFVLSAIVKHNHGPSLPLLLVVGGRWVIVEGFEAGSDGEHKPSGFTNLVVGLGLQLTVLVGRICLKAVLLFNSLAGHEAAEVALHGDRGFLMFGVEGLLLVLILF